MATGRRVREKAPPGTTPARLLPATTPGLPPLPAAPSTEDILARLRCWRPWRRATAGPSRWMTPAGSPPPNTPGCWRPPGRTGCPSPRWCRPRTRRGARSRPGCAGTRYFPHPRRSRPTRAANTSARRSTTARISTRTPTRTPTCTPTRKPASSAANASNAGRSTRPGDDNGSRKTRKRLPDRGSRLRHDQQTLSTTKARAPRKLERKRPHGRISVRPDARRPRGSRPPSQAHRQTPERRHHPLLPLTRTHADPNRTRTLGRKGHPAMAAPPPDQTLTGSHPDLCDQLARAARRTATPDDRRTVEALVDQARAINIAWTTIGRALEISGQAAWARYHRRPTTTSTDARTRAK